MDTALTFDKIWQLFQETDRKFQETDRKFQETDLKFQETDRKFQESQRAWERRLQETDREFQASQRALDLRFQETDRMFRETDKKMKALQELFEGQWGKLVESLVEGDLVRLLGKRGIRINDTSTRRKGSRNGESYEFDIIAHNGEEIVIVEVKTTLRVGPVEKFIAHLHRAKHYLPEYSAHTVLGAVAYLRAEQASDQYAQNQGLFVIRATGDSAAIINPTDFQPRKFG
ncbi:hypothetical protein [Candidatus Thiosymbion oneisti]|uniref:hypothetical protein n=1 Tax=Candidatus Thiosymbion oneisti TaxID=589554 RepID=UPI000B132E05|nr:hypothetical protein [Candidatus Thiosymbion oneisti]